MPQPLPPDSSEDHPDPWLTRGEAAEYAKVSPATISRAIQAGAIPHAGIPNGRAIRVRRSWIDAWLMNGSAPHAVAALLTLLLAGWLLACACGIHDACHLHQLLVQINRHV